MHAELELWCLWDAGRMRDKNSRAEDVTAAECVESNQRAAGVCWAARGPQMDWMVRGTCC